MISLLHFDATEPDFAVRAADALSFLAARPGYVRGRLARATDDPVQWVLFTEWADVGSYRRALGGSEMKLRFTPLLAAALDRPSAFESLVDVAPSGQVTAHPSDRADDPVGIDS